jgi:LytS/YehU family sensor histidine kinase
MEVAPEMEECLVPVYAVQTLVENAVRHGATPREEATEVRVRIRRVGTSLEIAVEDDGAGMQEAVGVAGTGLRRLRERIAALYGGAATLVTGTGPVRGFIATLLLPVKEDE